MNQLRINNMSDFIQKKDFWSITLFAGVFIGCYFLSKELSSNNLFVVVPISGLGAFVGYKLGNWITDKPIGMKVFLVLFWTVVFIGVVLITSKRQIDDKKAYGSETTTNLLIGKWETDDDKGFKIRLEIDGDEAIMSMSPNYEEIDYDLNFSEKSVQFKKEGNVKFDFIVEKIDAKSLTLSQSNEKLEFTRIE
ncbi:MFS transporter [Lunatibacter salilacus]|uniref:hypothetical protein n=1 Tax=Lunatibacter salilacus TaxID=2483804 RepID=UPI00131DDF59|nr:hypothetical protein [Lunatibacter salilacus]